MIKPEDIAGALLASGLVYGLGYEVEQSDFHLILPLYAGLFGWYLWVLARLREVPLHFYLALAVGLRVLLLFSVTSLSDDVYRFIWDGRLLLQGGNPFEHLPSWYLEEGRTVPGLTRELYDRLNSPAYFTIYPPVAQAVFVFACWVFPDSIFGSSVVMKQVLLAFELGSLWLLPRLLRLWELPPQRVLLYALNPLILIEIMGNLHFEGAMVFFLLLSLWCLARNRHALSAAALAASVASKLLPLMFLPLLLRRLASRRGLLFFGMLGVVLLLLFGPLLGRAFWHGFGSSLDLYFRRFEFNAGLYYVLRWLGYQWKGYNLISWIGPALALATVGGILLAALLERRPVLRTLPRAMLGAVTLYLLLATTVHPWYLSLPIVLCLFTPYRYPIVWSGLIFLT